MKIFNNTPALRKRRKNLRNSSTPAERLLWKRLQDTKIGYKFRRQHSFGTYIMDFYCPAKKIGIELDGEIHNSTSEHDEYRTRTLKEYGIKVLRFKNTEIENNISEVVATIQKFVANTPS